MVLREDLKTEKGRISGEKTFLSIVGLFKVVSWMVWVGLKLAKLSLRDSGAKEFKCNFKKFLR